MSPLLLFRTRRRTLTDGTEETSYDFGWLPILITAVAAAGSFGNFYLNLVAKVNRPILVAALLLIGIGIFALVLFLSGKKPPS